jgi:hypothetical protein
MKMLPKTQCIGENVMGFLCFPSYCYGMYLVNANKNAEFGIHIKTMKCISNAHQALVSYGKEASFRK